ncbi:MAG: hypothetical protein FXF54_04115 [Kosmotoga sp.]|nr:MAG: hypothetical protein FXF54_04115 [Kosmotoga sp.]
MKKFVVLVFLALVMSAFALAVSYSDVPEDHWAYDAVMKTTSAGLLKGFPNETFQGKEAVTRYQLAEALSKTLDYVDTGDQKVQEIVFALTKKVASLSLEISDSKKAVVDINNDIDGLKDRVGTLETDMDVVFDQVDSNVYDIMELENKITEMKKNIEGFVTADDFEYIENVVDKVSSDLFAIKLSKADRERVRKLEEKLTTLEESVVMKSEYSETKSLYDDKFGELEKRVNDLQITTKFIGQAVANLDKKFVKQEVFDEEIGVAYDQIDANLFDIMDLEDSVKDIKENYVTDKELNDLKENVIGPAFDQVNKNVSDLTTLNQKVAKVEEDLTTIKKKAESFVTSETLSQKMDFLYKKIGITEKKLSDNVSSLANDVSNIKEQLEVAYDQIDANLSDIMDLEDAIKDVRSNYVTNEDFEYVENVIDKLSSDLFAIKLAKADAKDVKALEEKVSTLESNVNEKVEAVKSDVESVKSESDSAVKKVDEKVEKASKTANSSLWIGLAGLAVGIAALIVGLQ